MISPESHSQPTTPAAGAVSALPTSGREPAQVLGALSQLGGPGPSRSGLAGFDQLVGLALAQIGVSPDDPALGERLGALEADVVRMVASELGDADAVGTMVHGLAEAADLVCVSAREHARVERGIKNPTLVCADTAHPAFAAAAHRAGIEQLIVPTNRSHRIDIDMISAVVDNSCALVVVSAPSPFFGVVDPVVPVARMAAEAGALCHVDAGIGGWVLPFLGSAPAANADEPDLKPEPVPFDLRVPGVSSVAVDLEQYGYAAPGTSVLLYRDGPLAGRQYYLHDAGPGPAQQFPGAASTLDPYSVLVAWLVLQRIGAQGYRSRVLDMAGAVRSLRSQLARVDGVTTGGDPGLPLLILESGEIDLGSVAERLRSHGWSAESHGEALRLQVWPNQVDRIDRLASNTIDALATAPARVTSVNLSGS